MYTSFLPATFAKFVVTNWVSTRGCTILGIGLFLFAAGRVAAGSSNSLMAISDDGKLLACSNRDGGTVTIVDLATNKKLHETTVGHKPEGVTFIGSSHRLAVAVYADDCIVFMDADSGEKTGQVDVFDEPYGIVSDKAGGRLFVTLDYPGQVVEIDTKSLEIVRKIGIGKFLRGVALDGENKNLFVTEYYTSRVLKIDIGTGNVVDEWASASTDNLARQITLNPQRPKAYIPHIRSRHTAVHGEGSIFPYISVVDTASGDGSRRKRIPMDSFIGNLVTSNPWEVDMTPDGRTLFVVFSGTNDMFVCNVIDDDYRELTPRRNIQLGSNPRAVRVTPDGKHFCVYDALDFNVTVFDCESLQPVAKIQVSEPPFSKEILQGKKLFYTALQPMVGLRWISCSSCHPDGEPDGRTWHNPEGLRNTQSFAAMAWTHPIHWSADRDEVQDFEHTIRGPLMQGRGLIRGAVQEQLGPPNKGRSADLDALAAYSNSHSVPISPHAKSGLNDAAKRGREIFFAAETKCATCHSGPFFTDSRPGPAADIKRHDVGTGKDDPTEKMGPAFDTPTLLGVYRTAPYLHHGAASTLEDVVTKQNTSDLHGKTSHLTPDQIHDLTEFLRALPYEDPEPAAVKAGLTKIER